MEKRIRIDSIKFQTAGFSPLQWAKATLSILSIGFHFSISTNKLEMSGVGEGLRPSPTEKQPTEFICL